MGKRKATKQMTAENWDKDESESQDEAGPAGQDILAGRKIVKVKRHCAAKQGGAQEVTDFKKSFGF
jgi:hypothetical protein